MSGGSFDYLYSKDIDAWVGQQCTFSAEEMINALIAVGAEDAAKETRRILSIADSARVRLESLIERMSPLWRAMEWWKSCDTTQDSFEKALAKWRGEEVA